MSEIILIRGLPGSGKTTMAHKIATKHGHVVMEADLYFYDEKGVYDFDPKELKKAHCWCQMQVSRLMYHNKNIVVANTFIRKWEMEPYYKLADDYGYFINVIVCSNNYGSIHHVPDWKIKQMEDTWEV